MTIICMELPSLAQQINSDQERIKLHPLVISTKYCFLILGEDTRFIFFIYFSFLFYVFMSIFVIYKVFLLPYFNVFIIIFLQFFKFFHVPECSGMFHVPGFIDARFSTRVRFSYKMYDQCSAWHGGDSHRLLYRILEPIY